MGIFRKIFGSKTVLPASPSPAPSRVSPIYGTDVYHGDDVNSWSEMKANGIDFVFCKASEGMGTDSKVALYFPAAKKAGLITGLYHFYSTGSEQIAQARHFAKVCSSVGLSRDDLPPVFDFEKASGNFNAADSSRAQAFLTELEDKTGRLPMIYMSQSTFSALGNPAWMKKYPWWIARYRPLSQGPGIEYTIWQYSESASIPGLGNPGDKNIFQGSVADLKAFIAKT